MGARKAESIKWSKIYEFHTASLKKDFSFIATGDVVSNQSTVKVRYP